MDRKLLIRVAFTREEPPEESYEEPYEELYEDETGEEMDD
jgi:hypothetical protein